MENKKSFLCRKKSKRQEKKLERTKLQHFITLLPCYNNFLPIFQCALAGDLFEAIVQLYDWQQEEVHAFYGPFCRLLCSVGKDV